ncbi:MAG: DUF418 domain-containing protein, partial [Rikenellaceae bacterium]
MDNGVTLKPRFTQIDALRGFAISAILLIHSSNHFLCGLTAQNQPQWLQNIDNNVLDFLYFVFEGKAYAIFAILFGFSFAMLYEKQRRKGDDFCFRMVWRMALLALFGVVNAVFFAGGDPLVFYAICMLFIIPMRKFSNGWLTVICVIFLLQPLELINIYTPVFGALHNEYYEALQHTTHQSNFLVCAYSNITLGLKACLMWGLETGRYMQTLGLFVLGMLVYRKGYYNITSQKSLKLCLVSVCFVMLFFVLKIYFVNSWMQMMYNLMFTFMVVFAFAALYNMTQYSKFWTPLAKLGQMSLTNFIAQSVVASFIYYPWGLNLALKLGVTASVLLALVIMALQMWFSVMWLKHHKRGPLEQLWHH